jgi:hypothetical protein
LGTKKMFFANVNKQKMALPLLYAIPSQIFVGIKPAIQLMSNIKIAALLVAVCLLNTTPTIAAKCVSWDLPQKIVAIQDNGFRVSIVFNPYPYDAQNSGKAGGATYYTDNDRIDGVVNKLQFGGHYIDFKIKWQNNSTAIYSGDIENGVVRGKTYEQRLGAKSQVGWTSAPGFPCVREEGQTKTSDPSGGAAFKKQREDELQVTGKSPRECETSNQSCEARVKAQVAYPASIGVIAKECQPYFQQCMANAARRLGNEAEAKKIRDNETQVTGRSPQQCEASFYSCRTRLMAQLGKLAGMNAAVQQCEPYRNQCLGNAAAANNQGNNGGGNGGGSSLATVVQSVDVYDTPGGEGQKIGKLRRGSKVSILGDCADSWCHVAGRRVPDGEGYVYNGDDYKSLEF